MVYNIISMRRVKICSIAILVFLLIASTWRFFYSGERFLPSMYSNPSVMVGANTMIDTVFDITSSTISAKNYQTGKPIEGITIKRYRRLNILEQLFNPVAADYFPTRLTEVETTDKEGKASFKKITNLDSYEFYTQRYYNPIIYIKGYTYELYVWTNDTTSDDWPKNSKFCYYIRLQLHK